MSTEQGEMTEPSDADDVRARQHLDPVFPWGRLAIILMALAACAFVAGALVDDRWNDLPMWAGVVLWVLSAVVLVVQWLLTRKSHWPEPGCGSFALCIALPFFAIVLQTLLSTGTRDLFDVSSERMGGLDDVIRQYTADEREHATSFLALAETTAGLASPNTQARALADIAVVWAKMGDAESAARLIQAAKESAESIDDQDSRDSALVNVAIRQGNTGDIAGADTTAESIEAPWGRETAGFSIAFAAAKAGNMDRARRFISEVDDPRLESDMCGSLAVLEAENGNAEQADAWFGETKRAAENITPPLMRDAHYGRLVQVYAKFGRFDEARLLADTIDAPAKKCMACAFLAYELFRAGKQDEAQRIMETAAATAGRITEPRARSEAHVFLASYLPAVGLHERARAAATEIEDSSSRDAICGSLAFAAAKASQIDHARAAAECVVAPENRVKAYFGIARACTENNDGKTARQWLRAARTLAAGTDDRALVAQTEAWTAAILAMMGNWDEAEATIKTIDLPDMKVRALLYAAKPRVKSGACAAATVMFEEARTLADRIDDADKRDAALEFIVEALCLSAEHLVQPAQRTR